MAVSVTRVSPPNAPTGVLAVADHGFEKIYNMESGSLVDRTTEMTNGTSLPTVFSNDNDYIYFGVPVLYRYGTISTTASYKDCRFVDIHVDLETVASSSITPIFQYSNGDNSWATLAVVDGTNGFTQSGTITFTRASIPSTTTWITATKDGSGNTIGDGTARGYVRIRRTADSLTTPPKIRTIGTGILSANKTYYYKVCHLSQGTLPAEQSNRTALRSLPSAEASATTTTTFRSVKISWDNNPNVISQMVWRTPTSGDYTTGFSSKDFEKYYLDANKKCDTSVQQVKGCYFCYNSGLTRYQDFIVDNGAPITFVYNSSYLLYTDYMSHLYKSYSKGDIIVSGGTSGTPATFNDISSANITNGWNSFNLVSLTNSFYRQFTVRDNLILKDYVQDESCSIETDSLIYSSSSYGSYLTFGRYEIADSEYYSRGVTFIQSGEVSSNMYMYLYRSNLYNCVFYDNPLETGLGGIGYRTYNLIQIQAYSNIRSCLAQANSLFEQFAFTGANITIDDFEISNARYGLDVAVDISLNNITISGTTGVYLDGFTDGGTFYFNEFKFKGAGKPLYNTYAVAKNDQYLHLVDCEFTACSPEDSVIGADTEVYRDWTTRLTILDTDGNPITGASVNIADETGTVEYNLTTDVNGQVSQGVSVAKYTGGTIYNVNYGSKYADVITLYDNFVITISKNGYETYSLPPITINKKMDMILKMRQQKQIVVSNNGIYINTDPKNLTDTLSLIKI